MLPFPIGVPWMLIFQSTLIFQARRPFLRISFPSMATGGPSMAMAKSGAGHRWTNGGPPMVHRWECPGPPMATGGIPWSLSRGILRNLSILWRSYQNFRVSNFIVCISCIRELLDVPNQKDRNFRRNYLKLYFEYALFLIKKTILCNHYRGVSNFQRSAVNSC